MVYPELMALSKEEIEEFKDIYAKEFGKRISDEKARELGENLVALFRIIYRPIPEEWREEWNRNHPNERL
jgi:hypothetical protein